MDMLDDDIVYLGSRNPQSPSTARPSSQSPLTGERCFHPFAETRGIDPKSSSLDLTGIVLHVEKCGSVEAQKLAFNRQDMAVVQIGRRSGFDPDRRRSSDIEQEGAMFRCAVVSRKHAKIAFSDSGSAYLIDLYSHHGTHIRRSEEKYMKTINPETPTLLHDGDVITFGKTVGKNEEAVRPVTVRVELVYRSTPASPSSVKSSSASSRLSVSPQLSYATPPKPSSGRYGVNASSSSDNESYSSGLYSDVDDVPSSSPAPAPPTEEPAPLPPHDSQSSIVSPKGKTPFNAVNLLKNLLPPLHPPTPRENLPSVADIMHRYFRPTPPLLNLFDSPKPSRDDKDESQPVGFDASQHDIYEPDPEVRSLGGDVHSLRSRSESPMDLASTSPSPAPEVIVSRHLSIPPLFTPVIRDTAQIDAPNADAAPESSNVYKAPSVNLTELYDLPGILSHSDSPVHSVSASSKETANPSGDLSDQIKNIRDNVMQLQEEVTKLHNHRKKYKARFTSNTEFMNQKLGEFYDKVDEANAECALLYDKVDAIRSVDIPDMQAQVDMLEERMEKLEGMDEDINVRGSDADEDEEAVQERQPSAAAGTDEIELMVGVAKVKSMIDELTLLRDNAMKDVAAELESIKVLRQTAMADIEKAKAELAAQALKFAEERCASPSPISFRSGRTTPVPPSLKRKRDDTDENEDRDEAGEGDSSLMSERFPESEFHRVAQAMPGVAEARDQQDVAMEGIQLPLTMTALRDDIYGPHVLDSPPPRKRARRVVSVVAQTATAVTIGAVVTWTALAFS
ncbi:hypothetical protein CVT24_009210 [Panaeolus cyanescens]|uniref:FHA domain-containing protein n=1 Tax=Panaeolus cyanescens TaxID=181874 RepID=A0A409Y8K1_9AGAR|nr:hypothetical protein CVT24_009210 [Panaeolus cyanescens]